MPHNDAADTEDSFERRMTGAERARLHGELRHQRDTLTAELQRSAQSLASVREARSGRDADDEHDPEGATLSQEWSRIAGLDSELVSRSETLDRALARMADGTFGTCIRCDQQIGFARLEAVPAAELCITCAREIAGRTHA
ncbi:TraR/DksA family transcriptional regulator [Subtercola frigoramans]|uniref:RNA polymerase-binding transcription factor DksA n=1 Tax=Subtercola frigoramans TaxID=120298 RepID=A0ABS2L069_9MICO|nr:TraR/DksA C4-type zinc finger protein [Subtercola frigoramans]MBM7470463.1 RNA polymerase-binding transcription factor DksA [Subtercola frigoramans]